MLIRRWEIRDFGTPRIFLVMQIVWSVPIMRSLARLEERSA